METAMEQSVGALAQALAECDSVVIGARTGSSMAVVFNVFHETDEALYRELLY